MKKTTMRRLLHAVLIVGGVLLAVLFFWAVPMYGKYMATVEAPEFAYAYWPCLIWAWCFAAPIFAALIPAWRIFSSISAPEGAFTHANAKCFRWISYLAFADAVIFSCVAVGLAALVLSHLVDDAAGLKEESDLTI